MILSNEPGSMQAILAYMHCLADKTPRATLILAMYLYLRTGIILLPQSDDKWCILYVMSIDMLGTMSLISASLNAFTSMNLPPMSTQI
jgi:hypothetical protein